MLPLDDSLESIFGTLGHAALIHQAGRGTGFSFSRLRPEGDPVHTTGGRASGPDSFVRLFDAASQVVRMGGRRRAANMAVLNISHPDIEAFIAAKADPDSLPTFNLSVGVTDEFMSAVTNGDNHRLVHPCTGRVVRRVPARAVFDLIAAGRSVRCRATPVVVPPGRASSEGDGERSKPAPDRLDLNDELARRARTYGVRFAINTDAHAVPHLDHIRFGVAIAQRAWIEPGDVINTYPQSKLRRFLAKRPSRQPVRCSV